MSRLSSTWVEQHWGPPCSVRLVPISFNGTCNSNVNALAVTAFSGLSQIFAKFGYRVKSCGVYNCRKIKGSSRWSTHSWAIAVDINPNENPWGPWVDNQLITDLPDELIDYVENKFKTVDGLQVFFWGGRWTRPDPMHFQLILTPEELSRGLVLPGIEDEEEEENMLQNGDRGNAVVVYQKRLNLWRERYPNDSWVPLTTDGIFGDKTEEAVVAYQAAAQIDETGKIDGITADLLARYDPPPSVEVPEVTLETEVVEVIKSVKVV